MSLTNPNKVITEQRLSEFYGQILPYLGGMPEAIANKFDKANLYSTDEKIVGCWVDGKPIYKYTYVTTSDVTLANNSWATVFTYDGSIDIVAKTEAIRKTTTASECISYPVGCDVTSSTSTAVKFKVDASSSIVFKAGSVFTIYFTKTTDAANSFNIGSDTDYSTDEKIVGTWIDGKPLYQKTVDCGAMPNNTVKSVPHNVANMGLLVHEFGMAYKADYSDMVPLPSSTSGSNTLSCSANTTNINLKTVTNLSQYSAYVTIQYTKTT